MAVRLNDGTLLIQGALDGFSLPLPGVKKVKGVGPTPTLLEHVLKHGRPATQEAADRQETIKARIKAMQALNPKLTFVQCWDRLARERPELFE
jgi:hypothetical protein